MIGVWAVAPSIRPGGGTLPKWREAGYKVAVLRQGEPFPEANITLFTDRYLGWAKSINTLIAWIENFDAMAEWFVVANDDTLPDPNHTPEEIAMQCRVHFGPSRVGPFAWSGFGVMQPIGDLLAWPNSRIDKFAGSPWIGREFARRMYGGKGPLFEGHFHCWADNEIMDVATLLGVFWQRPDLSHRHEHWGRGSEPKPDWWDDVAGRDYTQGRALYEERKRLGFPGHEPLPL